MIAQFKRTARGWTLAAAACMLVLIGIGLTDAVRGDSPATRASGPQKQDLPVSELQAKTRQLIEEMRYPEALALIAKILAQDPHNEYALGVRPLVLDKATLARAASQPAGIPLPAAGAQDNDKAFLLLQKRLPEVRFDAIGFSDVVDFLRDITGANMFVNWRALEAAGIDRNTPVSTRLKDATFQQVLTQITRDVGGGQAPVEFAVEDGIIVISTQAELASHPQMRTFDVSDLLTALDQGSAAALEKVVLANVKGGVTVTAYQDRLLVKGTTAQILEVEKVLNELRRKH